jgi:hypothetical protein
MLVYEYLRYWLNILRTNRFYKTVYNPEFKGSNSSLKLFARREFKRKVVYRGSANTP